MRRIDVGGDQGRGNPLMRARRPAPDVLSYVVAAHVCHATPGLWFDGGSRRARVVAEFAGRIGERARRLAAVGRACRGVLA